MKIRDAYATLNRDNTEYEMPSGGLEILADDGRTLFGVSLEEDGSIRVDAGMTCKHNGKFLDDRLHIKLIAANCFYVARDEYNKGE